MPTRAPKSAAVITVFNADMMTKQGRKRIAKWMREQAEFLEEFGPKYSWRFTSRYMYASRKK